jgi:hypothetical protein
MLVARLEIQVDTTYHSYFGTSSLLQLNKIRTNRLSDSIPWSLTHHVTYLEPIHSFAAKAWPRCEEDYRSNLGAPRLAQAQINIELGELQHLLSRDAFTISPS